MAEAGSHSGDVERLVGTAGQCHARDSGSQHQGLGQAHGGAGNVGGESMISVLCGAVSKSRHSYHNFSRLGNCMHLMQLNLPMSGLILNLDDIGFQSGPLLVAERDFFLVWSTEY